MNNILKKRITSFSLIVFFVIIIVSCKKEEDESKSYLPAITTTNVTSVLLKSAVCGGNITSDGNSIITQRGVCYSTKANPTINDFITKDGDGTGNFTSHISGLTSGTKYYVKAYAKNNTGANYGDAFTFTTADSIVTDIDKNTYKTIQIGNQIWMAENLRTTKYKNGASIHKIINSAKFSENTEWKYCTTPAYCWYSNDSVTYSKTYGALYNWYTVDTEYLCPAGWHVPTDDEWTKMEDYLIAEGYNYDGSTTDYKYAKALASTTSWNSSTVVGAIGNTDFSAKRNITGFNALAGGFCQEGSGQYSYLGTTGYWWSSSKRFIDYSIYRSLSYDSYSVFMLYRTKQSGFSVRCVRN
jgi:uncharacterized protein (TIGR02145 family)